MLTLIKKETPDIVLISETKLNYRHKVRYKNYSIIRHDRSNATKGGGTAILIKKTPEVQNNPNRQNNKLQNPRDDDHKNKNKQYGKLIYLRSLRSLRKPETI